LLAFIRKWLFSVAEPSATKLPLQHLLLRYWLPAIAWTFFIFQLAGPSYGFHQSDGKLQILLHWLHFHIKQETVDMVNGFIRKSGHVAVYWILSLLWFRVLRGVPITIHWDKKWMWTALVICLSVASVDEYHQLYVLGRSGEWHDVLLDMVGAGYAQWILYRMH
jgi:VanZ family protein